MKSGDLIYDSHYEEHGVVVTTKPCEIGQGEWCTILYEDGQVVDAFGHGKRQSR